MKRYLLRAVKDFIDNRFLTVITVITIALSILIAASFALFFLNAGEILNFWQKGIRMMVYLKDNTSEAARADTAFRLKSIAGVASVRFISKQEALQLLKDQMAHHTALLENLRENPLPDAFEVSLQQASRNSEELQFMAERIQSLPAVAEVEYGQQWIQRFSSIINLFSLAGYAIGALFFAATVFIVANTIRLVLYSRRDEIEIMRLVGATDRFIKIPFYLVGMIQGGVGTFIGLAVLFIGYIFLSSQITPVQDGGLITMRFFSISTCMAAILAGTIIGWVGCWVSLKQFMKS